MLLPSVTALRQEGDFLSLCVGQLSASGQLVGGRRREHTTGFDDMTSLGKDSSSPNTSTTLTSFPKRPPLPLELAPWLIFSEKVDRTSVNTVSTRLSVAARTELELDRSSPVIEACVCSGRIECYDWQRRGRARNGSSCAANGSRMCFGGERARRSWSPH